MASEALKKFADELKLYRESKSITLQQIAVKTKIDLKFLQAIEDANYEVLPELYIRAFIKEYAQTLDLSAKETLQKYEKAKSGAQEEEQPEEVTPGEEIKEEPPQETVESPETVNNSTFIPTIKSSVTLKTNYLIGGIIIIIALIMIYFLLVEGSSSEIIQVPASRETVQSNQERFELENKALAQEGPELQSAVTAPLLSPDSLYLSVVATDRVWLKVTCDGEVLQQGLADANSKKNFTANKNISFTIGNAGRVKVYLNNNPVENVGKPGEIRNLYITSSGIKFSTITPQKNEKKSPTPN